MSRSDKHSVRGVWEQTASDREAGPGAAGLGRLGQLPSPEAGHRSRSDTAFLLGGRCFLPGDAGKAGTLCIPCPGHNDPESKQVPKGGRLRSPVGFPLRSLKTWLGGPGRFCTCCFCALPTLARSPCVCLTCVSLRVSPLPPVSLCVCLARSLRAHAPQWFQSIVVKACRSGRSGFKPCFTNSVTVGILFNLSGCQFSCL